MTDKKKPEPKTQDQPATEEQLEFVFPKQGKPTE